MYNKWSLPQLALTAIALSSCSSLGFASSHIDSVPLVENVLDISKAHRNASASIVLDAILESRDRGISIPATLSAINSKPTRAMNGEITLSPLGLGNPSGPLQSTNSKITQNNGSSLDFTVSPIVGKDANSLAGVLSSSPPAMFKLLWETGWPKDVLLNLMVEPSTMLPKHSEYDRKNLFKKIESESIDGQNLTIVNRELESPSCEVIGRQINFNNTDGIIEKYTKYSQLFHGSLRLMPVSESDVDIYLCTPDNTPDIKLRIEDNKNNYFVEFKIRSVSSMIYYLGEIIRKQSSVLGEVYPYPMVAPPSECKNVEELPLFTVTHSSEVGDPNDFAVSTTYRGERYYAVKKPEQNGCPADRSQTVMMILLSTYSQLQNPDFFNAPNNVVINQ